MSEKKSMAESVSEGLHEIKGKVEMVAAHGKDVVSTGGQALEAAKSVVANAGRDAMALVTRTKDELKRTLKEGAGQVGDKLSRIATPTRKEEALARKEAVKAKKQGKRRSDDTESPAAPASP